MRSVDEHLERIIKMLVIIVLDKYSDAKTSSDARCLIGKICKFYFIFSLCVLKFILSNTSTLWTYFQGKFLTSEKEQTWQFRHWKTCLPLGCTSDFESYYRVNFLCMDLDQVIGELIYRFKGFDNNFICNIGEICLAENPKIEQFEKVSKFYNLN